MWIQVRSKAKDIGLDPLEKLQTSFKVHGMGAGSWAQVLWKTNQQVLFIPELCLQPSFLDFTYWLSQRLNMI